MTQYSDIEFEGRLVKVGESEVLLAMFGGYIRHPGDSWDDAITRGEKRNALVDEAIQLPGPMVVVTGLSVNNGDISAQDIEITHY